MLSISTIPEALAELEKLTGRAWTDSEIFDVVTAHSIELHAAPPITAEIAILSGINEIFRGRTFRKLAVLFPWQVGQLWISGETKTSHPIGHNEMEGEFHLFTEPVRVTRENVRIMAKSLRKIQTIWEQAQAPQAPDEARNLAHELSHGPAWIFPQSKGAPAAKPEAVRGIDKRTVMAAFNGLKWDFDHWGKNLASPSCALKDCRKAQGNKTASALWNPADIALYLLDEGVPLKKLDAVFVGLSDWADEWREKTALERD